MEPSHPPIDPGTSPRKRRALELAWRHLAPGRVQTLQQLGIPLVVGRREGYVFWDLDGHRLIDLHLNGGTFNLGHRHPAIVDALVAAATELDIGNHHFPSEPRAELAAQLAALAPGDLPYAVFAPSGGEAIDVAIKSARVATGRRRIVGIAGGYHGRTGLSGAVGDDAAARYFHSDRPEEFAAVPFDDLDAMAGALAGDDVAAVVLETIPATCGFPLPSDGYLAGVRSLCDRHGALYVADEVQTGLGRTGRVWAVETFGVMPDVLVTGKGLSGGMYPMAAALLGPRAAGWLVDNGWGYVSTFGGAEIGCRVAARALELSTAPETLAHVRRLSEHFATGLTAIAAAEPFLVEVRRCGLVMGLRFDHPEGALHVARALYARGVWAMFAGFDTSVLQWKPGLLMDEALCDEALDRLAGALRVAKDAAR